MKKTSLFTFLVGVLISSNSMAFTAAPIVAQVPVVAAYSPFGFDSNDNVEVMIEGFLPNLCYKSPIIKTKVKGSIINITVNAYKAVPTNFVCLEMIVPFVERVSLGIMEAGNYQISINNKIYSNISITKTRGPLIDENIYASVESVAKINGKREILLKGYNPSDCLELDSINVISNGRNVYSILPIMKRVGELCSMKMVEFSYAVTIPKDLGADKVLLHVRSMDGRSINTLFNNAVE